MNEKETIVISLGGSVVVPEMPNPEFIKSFKEIILKEVSLHKKFVIIVGGGKICRNYNDVLRKIINPTNETLDWMGIYATQFNAQLVRLAFDGKASDRILTDPLSINGFENDIIIGAGYIPGHSTDTDAVMIAKEIGAKRIINLSSIDYVYDSDPRINKDAVKFENITWDKYLSIIPNEWEPGLNIPFDPIASREAKELNIEVVFMSGNDLNSLENYFRGESFRGTSIKD